MDNQKYDMSLALLTKCKELVDVLQNLYTLAMVKCPESFNPQRNVKEGLSMFAPVYRLRALTLNNMGCTYLKQNRVTEAFEHLKQTFEIEQAGNYSKNQIAQTSLNLCCVLSKMKKHKAALEYAMKAILMFQDEITNLEKLKL